MIIFVSEGLLLIMLVICIGLPIVVGVGILENLEVILQAIILILYCFTQFLEISLFLGNQKAFKVQNRSHITLYIFYTFTLLFDCLALIFLIQAYRNDVLTIKKFAAFFISHTLKTHIETYMFNKKRSYDIDRQLSESLKIKKQEGCLSCIALTDLFICAFDLFFVISIGLSFEGISIF